MPTLLGEKRDGSSRVSAKKGGPVVEETYSYLVEADYAGQSRLEILQTPGLPIAGLTASAGGYAMCRQVSATRRQDKVTLWDVVAEFSSEVEENSDNNDPSTDPTAWIPVYETKWEPLQEVVARDLSGKAIVNSVGQPYETGLTITRKIPVWEFYQFEPISVTDETIIDRHESVNSGEFRGRKAKTLLLSVLSSVVGFYYGQRRRLTQYQLKWNRTKWTHKRLDVGTTYLDLSGNERAYKVKDINGDDVQILGGLWGPKLDEDGEPIDPDPSKLGQPSGGFDTDDTTPLADQTRENVGVLSFDVYPEINFSFLRV